MNFVKVFKNTYFEELLWPASYLKICFQQLWKAKYVYSLYIWYKWQAKQKIKIVNKNKMKTFWDYFAAEK